MSEKKGATRQSFIRKEITTYRIGTLEIVVKWILWPVAKLIHYPLQFQKFKSSLQLTHGH